MTWEVAALRAHIIWLEDRAGTLAELCEALEAQHINISGIAVTTWQDRGAVAMTTDNEQATRSVLEERGGEHKEVELVAAGLEDQPGALANAARKLADRGINIHAVILMGVSDSRRIVGFVVDVPAAARDALGEVAMADNEF